MTWELMQKTRTRQKKVRVLQRNGEAMGGMGRTGCCKEQGTLQVPVGLGSGSVTVVTVTVPSRGQVQRTPTTPIGKTAVSQSLVSTRQDDDVEPPQLARRSL